MRDDRRTRLLTVGLVAAAAGLRLVWNLSRRRSKNDDDGPPPPKLTRRKSSGIHHFKSMVYKLRAFEPTAARDLRRQAMLALHSNPTVVAREGLLIVMVRVE